MIRFIDADRLLDKLRRRREYIEGYVNDNTYTQESGEARYAESLHVSELIEKMLSEYGLLKVEEKDEH